jgi:hypothetical protein
MEKSFDIANAFLHVFRAAPIKFEDDTSSELGTRL